MCSYSSDITKYSSLYYKVFYNGNTKLLIEKSSIYQQIINWIKNGDILIKIRSFVLKYHNLEGLL